MGYDLLFRGGRIVAGSGLPSYLGDVAIKDGKIVELSPEWKRCQHHKSRGPRRRTGIHRPPYPHGWTDPVGSLCYE